MSKKSITLLQLLGAVVFICASCMLGWYLAGWAAGGAG